MKKEILKCKSCKTIYNIFVSKEKGSNGAYFIFYKRSGQSASRYFCHGCKRDMINKKNRESGQSHSKKYEKTIPGFLMRSYSNLRSRCLGRVKPHLYKGLDFFEREEFYDWTNSDGKFFELYHTWKESGYDRKLSPSVDRIDPDQGYIPGNVRWVTHSENSSRIRKSKTKVSEK